MRKWLGLLVVVWVVMSLAACSGEKTTNAGIKSEKGTINNVSKEEELSRQMFEAIFITGEEKELNFYTPDVFTHYQDPFQNIIKTPPYVINSAGKYTFEFDKVVKVIRHENVGNTLSSYKFLKEGELIGYGQISVLFFEDGNQIYILGTGNEVSEEVSAKTAKVNQLITEAQNNDPDVIGYFNFVNEFNRKNQAEFDQFILDASSESKNTVKSISRTSFHQIMHYSNEEMFTQAYEKGLDTFASIMMNLEYTLQEAELLQETIKPVAEELGLPIPTPDQAVAIYFLGNLINKEDLRVGFVAYDWYVQHYPDGYKDSRDTQAVAEVLFLREEIQEKIDENYYYIWNEEKDMMEEAVHDLWAESLNQFKLYLEEL